MTYDAARALFAAGVVTVVFIVALKRADDPPKPPTVIAKVMTRGTWQFREVAGERGAWIEIDEPVRAKR